MLEWLENMPYTSNGYTRIKCWTEMPHFFILGYHKIIEMRI